MGTLAYWHIGILTQYDTADGRRQTAAGSIQIDKNHHVLFGCELGRLASGDGLGPRQPSLYLCLLR